MSFACIKSGSETDPEPSIEEGQILFVDQWGQWDLYRNYYFSFSQAINEYVENRRYSNNSFNLNYLRKIEAK